MYKTKRNCSQLDCLWAYALTPVELSQHHQGYPKLNKKMYVLDPISIKNSQDICLHFFLASLLLFLLAFHATSALT